MWYSSSTGASNPAAWRARRHPVPQTLAIYIHTYMYSYLQDLIYDIRSTYCVIHVFVGGPKSIRLGKQPSRRCSGWPWEFLNTVNTLLYTQYYGHWSLRCIMEVGRRFRCPRSSEIQCELAPVDSSYCVPEPCLMDECQPDADTTDAHFRQT